MFFLLTRITKNLRRFIILISEDFLLDMLRRNLGLDVRDEV